MYLRNELCNKSLGPFPFALYHQMELMETNAKLNFYVTDFIPTVWAGITPVFMTVKENPKTKFKQEWKHNI